MRNTQGFLLLTLMYTFVARLHAYLSCAPDSRILSTIVINLLCVGGTRRAATRG